MTVVCLSNCNSQAGMRLPHIRTSHASVLAALEKPLSSPYSKGRRCKSCDVCADARTRLSQEDSAQGGIER